MESAWETELYHQSNGAILGRFEAKGVPSGSNPARPLQSVRRNRANPLISGKESLA